MYVGMPPLPQLPAPKPPLTQLDPSRIPEIQAALATCMGHIGETARKCKTSRTTLCRWIKQSPELTETLTDIREDHYDTICLKTTQLAMKGTGWAVDRMLKSKMGRDRGFGEHIEVEHTGSIELDDAKFQDIVKTMGIAELQVLAALQDKLDTFRPDRYIPAALTQVFEQFAEEDGDGDDDDN